MIRRTRPLTLSPSVLPAKFFVRRDAIGGSTPGERGRPRGFTLLEVLLALALTALLLIAITMAVDFQLRVVEAGRAQVEEAQLARAILRRIADDLRGAVRYDPMNVEDKVPSASSDMLSSTSGMSDDDLSQLSSQLGSGQSGTQQTASGDTDQTSQAGGETETGLPRSIPGLFGTAYEIQVDVSRLPRLDQFNYDVLPGQSPVLDRVSDVKTVAYFMSQQTASALDRGRDNRSGLMRRELDRAVTAHAVEEAGLESIELDLEPLATEVAGIEFQYCDGAAWVDSWDSSSQLGLPVAVKITLYILPVKARRELASRREESPAIDFANLVRYTVTVHLPGSEPNENALDWEQTTTDDDATTDPSGQTNQTQNTSGAP